MKTERFCDGYAHCKYGDDEKNCSASSLLSLKFDVKQIKDLPHEQESSYLSMISVH